MFKNSQIRPDSQEILASQGYWPAVAAQYLAVGKYSRAIALCRDNLTNQPELLSAQLIYARALYHAGQNVSASERLYRILAADPENIVALKYLAAIQFSEGDEIGALENYRKVLEVDPACQKLFSPIKRPSQETTRTVTIRRSEESVSISAAKLKTSDIPFFTETMGDLYLAQGHSRLALEVFRHLNQTDTNPRLLEKFREAEKQAKEKDTSYVKKKD